MTVANAPPGGVIRTPQALRSARAAATERRDQLHDCWVQLTPLGVQIPQLGLQHDVPAGQIRPPQISADAGPIARVSGRSPGWALAGGGHAGHWIEQICPPLQLVHSRCGGLQVSAVGCRSASVDGSASGSAVTGGAHSGQRIAQI
jgi:hypothetical protein